MMKLSLKKKVSATVAQLVERVLGMAPFLFKKEKAPGFKRNTNPLVLRVTHFFLGLALDLFLLKKKGWGGRGREFNSHRWL